MSRTCLITLLAAAMLSACGYRRLDALEGCATAADCVDAAKPFCVEQACVAGCASNADCVASSAAPLCQLASGACVSCLDDSTCTADAPVCDAAGSCRGCTADDECASGVCLEAEGTCAAESEVVFVAANASDIGDCTKAQACGTLAYALTKVSGPRKVISLTAGEQQLSAALVLARPVYIDTNGTVLRRDGAIMSVADSIAATIGNATFAPSTGGVAATVGASGSLRLYGTTMTGQVSTTGGTISAVRASFTNPATDNAQAIVCTNGTVSVSQSSFQRATALGMNCQMIIERSRFDMFGDGSVEADGGFARIENNIISNTLGFADSMRVASVASGSTVRFNTFVNLSGTASVGVALNCDSTVAVSSNLFAYNTSQPLVGCAARYSLFDATAPAGSTAGPGNQTADAATFFVDRARKDYHLAPASPARGKAEPGLDVALDFDGAARSSLPDVGAFQSR